jgi:hypothetical protein
MIIQIDASPAQIRKIKQGLKVRVKHGTGMSLNVTPGTFNQVTKSFNKNKGAQIKLTDEELELNNMISKKISPEAHGYKTNEQRPTLQPTGMGIGQSNVGFQARAGHASFNANLAHAKLINNTISSKHNSLLDVENHSMEPHTRMVGGNLLNTSSSMVSDTPPALMSQPFGANFQFQHTLPVQYQHFNKAVSKNKSRSRTMRPDGAGLYV